MLKPEFDWRVEAVQKFAKESGADCKTQDRSLSLIVGAKGTEVEAFLQEIFLHPSPDENGHQQEREQVKEEVFSRLMARDLKREQKRYPWGELRESPWVILALVGEAPFYPQVFFEALEHIFNDPDHR